jgi:hypothetical protein
MAVVPAGPGCKRKPVVPARPEERERERRCVQRSRVGHRLCATKLWDVVGDNVACERDVCDKVAREMCVREREILRDKVVCDKVARDKVVCVCDKAACERDVCENVVCERVVFDKVVESVEKEPV